MRDRTSDDDARMSWDELGQRTARIRDLFKKHKVPLVSHEGLERAILEAEALAKGEPFAGNPSPQKLRAIVSDAHVIWSLADHLDACVTGGIEVKEHLKQIRTGSTDYGTPASEREQKTIFFKDFEYELCIAATALKHGLQTRFSEVPNDPRGDLRLESLWVEVKHPNSRNGLEKLVRKFNSGLRADGSYGVFVAGLEDAFALGTPAEFDTETDFVTWLSAKRDEIEAFGLGFVKRVAGLKGVLATVQTTTQVEVYDGASHLTRVSNAIVFDDVRTGTPKTARSDAERVAVVFNPTPVRYSGIKHRLDAIG